MGRLMIRLMRLLVGMLPGRCTNSPRPLACQRRLGCDVFMYNPKCCGNFVSPFGPFPSEVRGRRWRQSLQKAPSNVLGCLRRRSPRTLPEQRPRHARCVCRACSAPQHTAGMADRMTLMYAGRHVTSARPLAERPPRRDRVCDQIAFGTPNSSAIWSLLQNVVTATHD